MHPQQEILRKIVPNLNVHGRPNLVVDLLVTTLQFIKALQSRYLKHHRRAVLSGSEATPSPSQHDVVVSLVVDRVLSHDRVHVIAETKLRVCKCRRLEEELTLEVGEIP